MSDEILNYLTRVIANLRYKNIIFLIMDNSKLLIKTNILRDEVINKYGETTSITKGTIQKNFYIIFDLLESLEIIEVIYKNKEKMVSLTNLGQRLYLKLLKDFNEIKNS